MKQPNIVIFLSDQQRADTLGHFGVFDGVTPNLDRLCEDGTCFDNCFTTNPVCGPARATLQSGKYPTETGNFINGPGLPPDDNLMAQCLKRNGYDTAYIGKWHLMKNNGPIKLRRGFDVPVKYRSGYDHWQASNLLEFTSLPYEGRLYDNNNRVIHFKGYRPDCLTDLAVQYIENHDKTKPFLLFLSQLEPHQQNLKFAFYAKKGSRERFENAKVPPDLAGKKGDYDRFLPDYLGACHDLDECVGRLTDCLRTNGLWENTLFLYLSDHGCHFKTRNSEYKRSCHESSIHVPLVMAGGAAPKAGYRKELTSLTDVPATVLSVAGVPIPDGYRGIALDKLVTGEVPGRDCVFVQISESQIGRAVRTDRYTYCVTGKGDAFVQSYADVYREQYLYDLQNDAWQNTNLIDNPDYETVRAELRKKLLGCIREIEHRDAQII